MGINERREREKAERRKTILNAARDLILERGVERVSMEDIARKAEFSKATVYLYFPGKDVLLNEISEEAARVYLEHFRPISESGLTGIAALKCFWRGYVELFGNSDEMFIIYQVRNFLNPGLPFILPDGQSKPTQVGAVLETMKTIIDQCMAEGVFDPELDSAMVTRLLLSMFSLSMDNANRMPEEVKKSPAVMEEMVSTFQIFVRGLARQGIDRSLLDITGG